ncbi:hypothetical protein [Shouchella patagoniensis]|uniref:hypothetical protein n=1 Tax=Shouchella patagoniensis TaxID=228576 RepID=UPI000995ADC9|nr:hypothetical protein [Shouchella patagoniensis]
MSHDKENHCDCYRFFRPCPPFPFPVSRGDGCQPLATVILTVLSLPANTIVTLTVNANTYTGTFIGLDVATGTIVFVDAGTGATLRFPTTSICSIIPV